MRKATAKCRHRLSVAPVNAQHPGWSLILVVLLRVGWICLGLMPITGCALLSTHHHPEPSEQATAPLIEENRPYSDQALADRFRNMDLEVDVGPGGITLRLQDLAFGYGEASLSPEAQKILYKIAELLNEPGARDRRLSVEGHTDSVGGEAFNKRLSRVRAETVAGELIFNRIQAQRVKVKGWGEERPLIPDTATDGRDDPAARARNRRVEIVVHPLP